MEVSALGLAGSLVSQGSIMSSPRRSAKSVFKDQDGKARALLARMTLEEKIGQMIQADQEYIASPTQIIEKLAS